MDFVADCPLGQSAKARALGLYFHIFARRKLRERGSGQSLVPERGGSDVVVKALEFAVLAADLLLSVFDFRAMIQNLKIISIQCCFFVIFCGNCFFELDLHSHAVYKS